MKKTDPAPYAPPAAYVVHRPRAAAPEGPPPISCLVFLARELNARGLFLTCGSSTAYR